MAGWAKSQVPQILIDLVDQRARLFACIAESFAQIFMKVKIVQTVSKFLCDMPVSNHWLGVNLSCS